MKSLTLLLIFLCLGNAAYADVTLTNTAARTYSLLSRLNVLVDSFGHVNNYPACIYNEATGNALSSVREETAFDSAEWGINQWVSGVYGDSGYEGFVVQSVSLQLAATTLADCDALGMNPQPIRILETLSQCGGQMINNILRCPIQGRSSTLLHELGHMVGLPHEFSYYDADADHPLGPASVMNYDHFLSLTNLTDNDIETAKWLWLKSQNDLSSVCPDNKVHLTHACLPAYFGAATIVEGEIKVGDQCLSLSGNDVVTTLCDGQQNWEFKYNNLQSGYAIIRDGRCLGINSSTLNNQYQLALESYDSADCEMSLKSIWGIRQWGSKVQIQSSEYFYQHGGLDSNGCLTMDDDPIAGNCGDWDNDASPSYKTMDNTVLTLPPIPKPETPTSPDDDDDDDDETDDTEGELNGWFIIILGLIYHHRQRKVFSKLHSIRKI